jgi:thioredoxin reductase (NADPH)
MDMDPDHAGLPSDMAGRVHQAFPVLSAEQVEHLLPFGVRQRWHDGKSLFEAGKPGPGMFVVLSGQVAVTRRDGLGHDLPVAVEGRGQFLAEVGQLSGKPAFVDGRARGEVEALLIAPERLRALLVAEAEIGEMVMRALILRRVMLIETGAGGPLLIGDAQAAEMMRLTSFLTRNGQPHKVVDPSADAESAALALRYAPGTPAAMRVVCPNGNLLTNPSDVEVAKAIGLCEFDSAPVRDVAIVGAGPAGLAAAVYAASEGLSVIVLEARAFGGQAGASSRIENYLGFPTGISGQALAGRAFVQAEKFGAEVVVPAQVSGFECGDGAQRHTHALSLTDGRRVEARAVIVASGAAYRRPELAELARFEGRGISYWASPIEGRAVQGREVALVGGGNSAGQAAVFLASSASKVHVLIRGEGLAATMSQYLVDRIKANARIELHPHSEVVRLQGDAAGLSGVVWRNGRTHEEVELATRSLFLFVGADPNTGWLGGCPIERDTHGFICTGSEVAEAALNAGGWGDGQRPDSLECSVRGVFAIGDVRAGSVKRVAAAVGEGAAVVAQVHRYLSAQVASVPAPAAPASSGPVAVVSAA